MYSEFVSLNFGLKNQFEKNISSNQSGMKIKIRLQKVIDPIVNVSRQTEAQKKQTETEKTNLPFVLDIVVNVQNQGPRDYCTY